MRLCQQATRLDPDYAEAWALMALAQAELRFGRRARRTRFQRPSGRSRSIPGLPRPIASRRAISRRRDALRRRRSKYEQRSSSIRIWEVNREVARMLFRHGHIREAIPYFEKSASLMDSDWNSPMMLVTCYKSFGEEEKMRKAAQTGSERAERAIAKTQPTARPWRSGRHILSIFGEGPVARMDPPGSASRPRKSQHAIQSRLHDRPAIATQ